MTTFRCLLEVTPDPGSAPQAGEPQLLDIDSTVFVMLGLFLILAFILTQWLWKPYLRIREERVRRVEGAREEAERLEAEGAARLARIEAQLAEARKAGHAERAKIRTAALAREQQIVSEAQASARTLLAEARAKLDASLASERASLQTSAATLGREIAEKALGREAGIVNRARFALPVALLFVLAGGVAHAADHPIPTEPVSGSFDHEPSHSGAAGVESAQQSGAHAESATGEEGHGEHAGIDPKTLALQILNFGVLLFILIWFGGRKLSMSLRSRHDQLKADIQGAAERRAAAEQRFREQDSRLANLERELTALRAEVQQAGERERAHLLEGAQEKAKRVQEETRFQLDQQVREAEQRLRAEVASTAVKIADELLRRSVGPEDERRLTQDFAAAAGTPAGEAR